MMKNMIPLIILTLAITLQGVSQEARAQHRRAGLSGRSEGHTAGMVRIPAGSLKPFVKRAGESTVNVESFYLDIYPVTNQQFLEFVKANPKWARSKVSRLFADARYLQHWESDFSLGKEYDRIRDCPVTNISWFAASAYSRWKGKRLPTTDEWEYAASAERSDQRRGGRSLTQYILDWYSKPTPPSLPPVGSTFRNRLGIWDMHGLVWEWVSDFNSYVTGGDSRSSSEIERNLFCAAGSLNAGNKDDYASFMRYGYRGSLQGHYTVRNLGFRCAMDVK